MSINVFGAWMRRRLKLGRRQHVCCQETARTRPQVTALEDRCLLSGFVVGAAGAGSSPIVRVLDGTTGQEKLRIQAYDDGFRGGVHVAASDDRNHDGFPDVIVTGAGGGGGPHIREFDGRTGAELKSFFAYDAGFHFGASVALGDVNHDGVLDIITGAGPGGGPHVKVFDGVSNVELQSFFAFNSGFTGGVNVGSGDIDHDGADDIVVGASAGGGPHVRALRGTDLQELRSFFAFDPGFHGGVSLAVHDIDHDGRDDIVVGAGPGGGPRVQAFSGIDNREIRSFFAFEPEFHDGVTVQAADINGDDRIEIVAARRGAGTGPRVRGFDDNGVSHDFFDDHGGGGEIEIE